MVLDRIGQESHKLSIELLDLNMTDMFILQQILQYPLPVLRFKVLEDVNLLLPKERQYTPTKFYYALSKLDEMGYVNIIEGEKRGSAKVSATEKTTKAIKIHLLNLSEVNVNEEELMVSLIEEFSTKNSLTPSGRILVILNSSEKLIDPLKIKAFTRFSDQVYLLAGDQEFVHYKERVPKSGIFQTKSYHEQIREANNYFESIIILEPIIMLNENKISEYIRVLKPNGQIILSSVRPVPVTNHFLVDNLFKDMQDPKDSFADIIDLMKKLLNHKHLSEPKLFEYMGFQLVWATKH